MPIPAALADDMVAIRRVALHGPGSAASIRAQLAACPTPSVRSWVFVRRLTITTRGGSVAPEFTQALSRMAAMGGDADVVVFPDFAAMATSFARDLLGGVAATRWYWRRLGVLDRWSGAAAAIGLLAEQPLDTWAVLDRWHDAGLLVPVWRQLTPDAAAVLLGAIGWATGTVLPERIEAGSASALPARLEPAVTFWRDAVAQAAAPNAAIHAAAVLSLLHWDPIALAMPAATARLAALARAWRIPDVASTAPRWEPMARGAASTPPGRHRLASTNPVAAWVPPFAEMTTSAARTVASENRADAVRPAATDSGRAVQIPGALLAREIPTGFGGVLFLINALNRLDLMQRLLDWPGDGPPSGWQLLHDLACVLGAAEEDEVIAFLAEQMGEPVPAAALVAELAACAAELYAADEIWPEFIRQPGLLRATASHLDLDLDATAIDIGIRRAGLDLDPGWVPWLGRVVRFHYPRLPQRPAH
jgi:hypothetical protein